MSDTEVVRPAHQQRVIDEHRDLTIKLNKLREFIKTPFFASLAQAEQIRLRYQSQFMEGYATVLSDRITAFIEE